MKVIVQKDGRGKKWVHHDYDHINIKNIQIFKETGISNDEEPRYTCTCCGGATAINESISKQGADLICGFCANSKYHGWAGAMFHHCHTLTRDPEL